MENRKLKIILSTKDAVYDQYVYGGQGDKGTFDIQVTFKDMGVVTGKKFLTNFRRPDGALILQEEIITDDNIFTFALDDRALEVVGEVILELSIKDVDGTHILTANRLLKFNVIETIAGAAETTVDPESVTFGLNAAKQDLEEYKDTLVEGLDYLSKGESFGTTRGLCGCQGYRG